MVRTPMQPRGVLRPKLPTQTIQIWKWNRAVRTIYEQWRPVLRRGRRFLSSQEQSTKSIPVAKFPVFSSEVSPRPAVLARFQPRLGGQYRPLSPPPLEHNVDLHNLTEKSSFVFRSYFANARIHFCYIQVLQLKLNNECYNQLPHT